MQYFQLFNGMVLIKWQTNGKQMEKYNVFVDFRDFGGTNNWAWRLPITFRAFKVMFFLTSIKFRFPRYVT